jgi:hypothetical protein
VVWQLFDYLHLGDKVAGDLSAAADSVAEKVQWYVIPERNLFAFWVQQVVGDFRHFVGF